MRKCFEFCCQRAVRVLLLCRVNNMNQWRHLCLFKVVLFKKKRKRNKLNQEEEKEEEEEEEEKEEEEKEEEKEENYN